LRQKGDIALILSSTANEPQVKAALDAAINLQIFDVPWTLFVVFSGSETQAALFYEQFCNQSTLFMNYVGSDEIQWVRPDQHDSNRCYDFAFPPQVSTIDRETFFASLELCRSSISF